MVADMTRGKGSREVFSNNDYPEIQRLNISHIQANTDDITIHHTSASCLPLYANRLTMLREWVGKPVSLTRSYRTGLAMARLASKLLPALSMEYKNQ